MNVLIVEDNAIDRKLAGLVLTATGWSEPRALPDVAARNTQYTPSK